jgi:C1A family cysteine protease
MIIPMRGRGYKPDPPGHRATPFRFHPHVLGASGPLPPAARNACAAVMNQGQTSECVAHAAANAMFPVLGFVASQTMLYGIAQDIDRSYTGEPRVDGGCSPSSMVHAIQTFGVVPRASTASYDAANSDADPATATQDPDLMTLLSASKRLVVGQYAAPTVQDIMAAVAAGFPVTAAMCVTPAVDAWDPASGPIGPQNGDPNHYVTIVGYDTQGIGGDTVFEVQNSWGRGWGLDGFFDGTSAWAATLQDVYVWDVRVA